MKPEPSSTSSSEPRALGVKGFLWACAGVVLVVTAFEAVVAMKFSMAPGDRSPSGTLTRFFSYGYSAESKLDRAVGSAGETPEPLVLAGWPDQELRAPADAAQWNDANARVIFYGMSFTNRIGNAYARANPEDAVLLRAGPAAPLNHTADLFARDPYRADASTVVVGVLSSSIPHLKSMTGFGWTPENPAPYAFPSHRIIDGERITHTPVIGTRDAFIAAWRSKSPALKEHIASLREHDAYWDPLTFNANMLDRSAFVRLVRRAWASRGVARVKKSIYSARDGYREDDPALAAVPGLLESMRADAESAGQQFIVILLHTQGEPGHLDGWLAGDLRDRGVTVISTVDHFDSLDPQNFLGDSHYTAELDMRLAAEVAASITSSRSPAQQSNPQQ